MRWFVNREKTGNDSISSPSSRSKETARSNIPVSKTEMMRQQVVAKIHWGAQDREVLDWLLERHGIAGSQADDLLRQAHRAKRKAVRIKALMMLAFSGCGILLAAGFIGLQVWSGVIRIGFSSAAAIVIGCVSTTAFVRNLWLLVTGKLEGSVD